MHSRPSILNRMQALQYKACFIYRTAKSGNPSCLRIIQVTQRSAAETRCLVYCRCVQPSRMRGARRPKGFCSMTDRSNGYKGVATEFLAGRGSARTRSKGIGVKAVREWARTLPRGAAVIDLG